MLLKVEQGLVKVLLGSHLHHLPNGEILIEGDILLDVLVRWAATCKMFLILNLSVLGM